MNKQIYGAVILSVVAVTACLLLASAPAPQNGRSSPSITSPNLLVGQTSTLLPNGSWLILGGRSQKEVLAAAYVRSVSDGSLQSLPKKMNYARAGHTATVLPNGSVLILGGVGADGQIVAGAEIYHPETQTFEVLSSGTPIARAFHTATLLTDGKLLIAGGVLGGGQVVSEAELWDYRSGTATPLSPLVIGRQGQSSQLLLTGDVLVWGGKDQYGNSLSNGELYDARSQRFRITGSRPQTSDEQVPLFEGSFPEDGADNVPIDSLIGLRFSQAVDVRTFSSTNVVLASDQAQVPARIVGAESGMLAFLLPSSPLLPGTRYTVSISKLADRHYGGIPDHTISFTTAGSSSGDDDGSGAGQNANDSSAANRLLPPAKALPGVTALAGRILRLNGRPLPQVTIKLDNLLTRTDQHGNFLLTNMSPGHHEVVIDGRTASRGHREYGVFVIGFDFEQGKTTTIPYTIWMPQLDTAHAVHINFPTQREVVVTNPLLPGLEFHIPPGTTITDIDGKVAREVGITPIPLTQPPFPLPMGIQVPLYFTIQPGGGYISVSNPTSPKGGWLVYPNAFKEKPGSKFDFWNYEADGRSWFIYGHGKVGPDGRQIFPDPGVVFYELSGAMIGGLGLGPPNAGPGPKTADPVDLSSGLFVYQKTDIVVRDVIPIVLTRTYRQNDSRSRAFGIGTTHPYDIFILGDENNLSYTELVLADGNRIRFDRISGTGLATVLQNVTTPGPFMGATFALQSPGWRVTLRDGTQLGFPNPSLGPANTPQQVGLLSITDRNGNVLSVTRDPNTWNITRITTPHGRYLSFSYDSVNRIQRVTDNMGRTVQYAYDAPDTTGRLNQVIDANSGIWQYGYDPSNNMTTLTDARNIPYLTNHYDANNRVDVQTLADGVSKYQFNYLLDGDGNVTETDVTDPNNNVRAITFGPPPMIVTNGSYVSGGYATTDTFARGKPEQQVFQYNRQAGTNYLNYVIDPLGRETDYTYDSLGNVTSVTALAHTQNAVTTTFTYDDTFSLLTSVTDPLGHSVTFGHDANGNLTTITDAMGDITTATYNSLKQLALLSDPMGNAWQFSYMGGDLTGVTDPLGKSVSMLTDQVGRIIASTDPFGQTTRYSYNPLDRLTQKIDPLGGVTAFQYDPNGRLLSLTDPRNTANPTTYGYDSFDRLQTRTDPLGHIESFGYDGNNNLTCVTDRRGKVSQFQYDGMNRVTFAGFGASTCTGGPYESSTTYNYDAGDRLQSVVDSVSGTITPLFDGLNRLKSETTPQGSVSYTYDAAGREQTMTVAGQPVITYTYDNANRLKQITQGSSNVALGYDADSRRTSLTLPNGVSAAYSYDAASDPTSIVYQTAGALLGNLTYGYDQGSRVAQLGGSFARTNLPAALAAATYDAANRLSTWGAQSFSYDAEGNLVNDGTNTYNWDARNQLSSTTGSVSASFQYDPYGRRISKTISGVSAGFLYDGSNMVQELSGNTPTANLLTGGMDEVFTRTGTLVEDVLSDGLGSTVATTDQTGNVATQYTYEPFGKTSSSGVSTTNAFQYTGRENDGTGLYFYRARYYNPTLQRFISQDPVGFAGGSANLYAYTLNSPTNFRDPTGQSAAALPLLLIPEAAPLVVAATVVGGLVYLNYQAYEHNHQFDSDAGASDDSPSVPVPVTSTPADPNGRKWDPGSDPDSKPKKNPCNVPTWPSTAEAMDQLLGMEGQRIPDGPTTPGRNKVVWDLGYSKITFEQHPYHPGIPGHSDPHWHVDTPDNPHQRYLPGEKIPGCQ